MGIFHRHQKEYASRRSSSDADGDPKPEVKESRLHIRFDPSERSLWEKAWNQTKAELGWYPPEEWHIGSSDISTEVANVHREASRRANETRNEERHVGESKYTYRQVYDNVVNWAIKFQNVGDIVVQADPGYATLPWALVRFAITVAAGESESYHLMIEGAETISSLVTQYPVIEQTYARMDSDLSAALRKSLLSFYIVILHFQIRTLQYFDASTGGKVLRAFKGMNPVTADNIRQQREAIDKHREKVDRDIGLVHADATQHSLEKLLEENDTLQTGQMELLTATRDGILALARNTGSAFRSEEAHIDRRFAEMAEMWSEPLDFWTVKLEEERIDREKEELRDIRRWLSVAVPETNYYDAREKRPMQLGDWLIEHRKFKEWEHSESSSFLWLYGFAGTGKTGLVCRVIQYLRDSLRNLEESRVAFFYCSNDKANTSRNENFSRSDPQEALRSIVSQLATSQQTRRAASILQEYYDTFGPHSDKYRILDYSDCMEILAAISKENLTVIVLDAFDECNRDTSPKLIQRLKEVVRRSPKKVKIFISTRPFPAIENELTPEQSIEVTAKNNGEDVRAFIKQTLETRINEKALLNGNVPRDLKADIEGTLTNRARNMFLYASLLINQLCDRNRTDDEYSIRRKLDELPKNLTDVYSRTMAEIHDDKNNSQRSCRIAQDTFKWLLCGQKRLPCEIFLEAVSPPERRTDIDEVLHACRTLIIREKDVFEFAHYSVREHISRMEEYSRSKCHVVATQSCLRILGISFETEKHNGLTESQQQFNQYALLYWPLHYESVGDNEMNEHRIAINAMLRTFLLQGRSKTDKYATWLTEAQEAVKRSKDDRYLSSKLDHLRANPPTALFAACVFGLDDIIGKFGRELDGLNKSNTYGQTALCLAIENNKLEVVKALLSRRFPADLNLLNIKAVQQFEDYDSNKPQPMILYASALQCAAATGALKIADYLIEKGAHIDMVAGYYGSPLQAAALRGHSDIVSLLLRKGAEPNSQGGYHGNALQAAAAGGHTEIINLLLENKPAALVNTPGGHYGSAIMAATCSGNGDTVWALLEEHANPNMWSRRHGRPLRKAASLGQPYKEIVSLLLDVGAEANLSPKGDAVDILHHAALHNMVDLAKYCLDHGCKIDMVTKQATWYHRRFGDFPPEFTPVGLACAEGHVEMVDFLLRCGAPFEEDREFSAPLWVAAYQGHAGVVDLLLDRFSAKHNEEEKRRYIEQPPHPKNGHPIVFAAVSSCKPAVVSTLLDHGAKYQANWFEASPLLATATYRCPDVTRVLLDYHKRGKINVQINKQARNGRTALSEACANNQPEIVEQLLDAGADYTIPTSVNNTCLHLACHRDNPALVSSLLSKISQDPNQARFHTFLNTRHESGQTALIPCAQAGKIQEVNIILKYGADYTIAGHAGNTPLHWACMNGHDNVVEAILNKAGEDCNDNPERFNAFLNRRNKTEGYSPLFWTCANNHPTTLKLLMSPKFSADYSTANNNDNTTLHCACHNRFFEIFQTLLEAASNDPNQQRYREWLNKRNSAGQTPAITATEMARPRMLDILLNAHGADYALSDNQGFTALHYGAHRNRGNCIRHLLECASRDRVSNPQKYMQWINQQSTSNRASALRDGAKQGFPDLVKILLDYGADWDCVDAAGRTALHYAVERGASEMFAALVDAAKKSKGDEGGGVGSESGEGNEDWEQRVKKWLEQRDKGGRGFWVMGRGLGKRSRGKAAELGVDGEWLSWRP